MSKAIRIAEILDDEADLMSETNTGVHDDEAYRDAKGLRAISNMFEEYDGNPHFDRAIEQLVIQMNML
jgi:hypothetical protein